ncbi:MAG TPA: hypothetical protein VH062_02250 [Polyangiaceae bacterium]|jgi:hypothetical protein|nr:hypothetical protein [Polyangiaceae bacterium]
MATPQFLSRADLDSRITAARVDQIFDRDGDGRAEQSVIDEILAEAEGEALALLLRAFTLDQVTAMVGTPGAHGPDVSLRAKMAWIACELASETKGEFIAEDGKGRYWARYTAAKTDIDKMSKGGLATPSGQQNKQTGGLIRPSLRSGEKPFVFAPSGRSRSPRGGF